MYQYKGVVARIVDGDTIHVLVDLGYEIYHKINYRLMFINAPELSTEEGKLIKNILTEKLLNKTVLIDSFGKDKYGRWLATIHLDGENINQWLLNNNYAVPYDK